MALLCVSPAKDNGISKARLDKKLFIDPEVSRKGSVFPLVVPSCVGEWGSIRAEKVKMQDEAITQSSYFICVA